MVEVVLDVLVYLAAAGALLGVFLLDWMLKKRMDSDDRRYGHNDNDRPTNIY
jgi:hypothetical protein